MTWKGGTMRAFHRVAAVGGTVGALAFVPGLAAADPGQHGPKEGHLIGTGEFGKIDLLGVVDVTDTPDLIADVAVSPDGNTAYLANWGEPDCAGPETGGQTSPDAGAYVIDISNIETDPDSAEVVGFIPSHQDTRPGEGMQVVEITTSMFSGDVLVMNNEPCDTGAKNFKGGVSLWDVTDPLKPKKLSEHFGDRGFADVNEIHSAFAWDAGDRAYVVLTDNLEGTDVDILDITNPHRPRLITELDLNEFVEGGIDQEELGLTDSFLHDMVVKLIDGRWIMLLSYWDGGYVLLDVTDPANPVFLGDTDFAAIDPELADPTNTEVPEESRELTPEGNAHQAEFTIDNRFFIGTDEDFDPYRATDLQITTGPHAGEYPADVVAGGGGAPALLDDLTLSGPVVYGGYGCPDSEPLPSPEDIPGYLDSLQPGDETIIVLQRGPAGDPSAPEEACFPGEKAHEAALAGWDAVVITNRHAAIPDEDPTDVNCGSGAFVDVVVAICIGHDIFHRLFNLEPVDGPYTYPEDLAIGTIGERIRGGSIFDGWGYVHLFDAATLEELDTFAIPEAHDPDFAFGFGDLS